MKNKKFISILIISQLLFFDVTKCLDQVTTSKPAVDLVKEKAKSSEAKNIASKVAKKAGKETLKEVVNALDFLFTIRMLKSLVEDGYNVTEAIADYVHGRTPKNIDHEEYKKICQYLEAKKKFKDCIIKNARKNVGGYGYPKECETLGKMFTAMGGYQDTKKITKIYKNMHKKYSHSFL